MASGRIILIIALLFININFILALPTLPGGASQFSVNGAIPGGITNLQTQGTQISSLVQQGKGTVAEVKSFLDADILTDSAIVGMNQPAVSGNIDNFDAKRIGILLDNDLLSDSDISNLKKKHLTKKNLNKLSDDCKLGERDEDKFEDAIEDHFGIKIRQKLFSDEEISLIAGAISSAECSDGKVIKGDFGSGYDSVLGNWDEVEEIALPLDPNTVVSMPNIKALDHFSYYSHLGNTYYYDNDRYIDSDGDGLTDYEEIVTYQTDANDRDTYPDFDSDLEYVNAINGNDAPTIFYKGEDFN